MASEYNSVPSSATWALVNASLRGLQQKKDMSNVLTALRTLSNQNLFDFPYITQECIVKTIGNSCNTILDTTYRTNYHDEHEMIQLVTSCFTDVLHYDVENNISDERYQELRELCRLMISSSSSSTSSSSSSSSNRNHQMCSIAERIVKIWTTHTSYLVSDEQFLSDAMLLFASICSIDHNEEHVLRDKLYQDGVFTITVDILRTYPTNTILCDAGLYTLYSFKWMGRDDINRRFVSDALNIALEALMDEYYVTKGKKFQRDNLTDINTLLQEDKNVIHAMKMDPVMGVVWDIYHRYKDDDQLQIQQNGIKILQSVVIRQRDASKEFLCSNCQTHLRKDQRLICSSCRSVIYCSKECQKIHWEDGGHKANCQLLYQHP